MLCLANFLSHLRKKHTNPIKILSEIREGNTFQLISWRQHYLDTGKENYR